MQKLKRQKKDPLTAETIHNPRHARPLVHRNAHAHAFPASASVIRYYTYKYN